MAQKLRFLEFDKIPKHFDFENAEKVWSAFWQKNEIFKYDPNASKEDSYIIDTPPPTVSGSLHIGHVFSYSQTDFIARYKRANGLNVFYPMGWDDNGLPTERRVQNFYHVQCNAKLPYETGLEIEPATDEDRKKSAPRQLSRQNFIELCEKLTHQDEEAFKALWTHLGLSIDWTQEYATINEHARKTSQLSFLDLFHKNHLYISNAPIMWDVDFQTSIAQAEMEDRPYAGNYYTIEFQVDGGDPFRIATTRPELLPACVGVTAHPDDERYKHLFGKYAITPLFGVKVRVFPSENVDMEKGTGIVMVCTFGDVTDVEWWKTENLPLRQIIDQFGKIAPVDFNHSNWESIDPEFANTAYANLVGKTVFTARKNIVELLGKEVSPWQGSVALIKTGENFERAVKFYEKGNKPLEFLPSKQWFVRLLNKKEPLIRMAHQMNWVPSLMKERFITWTENLSFDWNVSRQRYFGVPIPVWYPIDANGIVDYAKPMVPEMADLPVDPSIDTPKGYEAAQRDQPNGFAGEVDVFDTWFTSSVTPQINSHWQFNPERHKKLFPADLRPQAHEIIRTWTFYTVAKSLLHENTIPWTNIAISGWVLDPNRNKMSKSKGNIVTPQKLMQQYSSDGVRYWAAKAYLGTDTTFDEGMMKIGLRLSTKMFNAAKLVYCIEGEKTDITHPLDISFLNELKKLVGSVRQNFDNYEYALSLDELERFFWGSFTDYYIELVKIRAKEKDRVGTDSAANALRVAMSALLRMFAPFMPFITEEIWSWVLAEETGIPSIHKAPFPTEAEFEFLPESSNDGFSVAKSALQSVHKLKADLQMPLGQILENVVIRHNGEIRQDLDLVLEDVILAGRVGAFQLQPDESLKATEMVTIMGEN